MTKITMMMLIMETDLQAKQATKIQARVRGNQARQKKKKSLKLATIPPCVSSKGKVEDGKKEGDEGKADEVNAHGKETEAPPS